MSDESDSFNVDLKNHLAFNLRLNTLNWCPTYIRNPTLIHASTHTTMGESLSCTNDYSSKTSSGHGIQRELTIKI
jgi:hypothetical protein